MTEETKNSSPASSPVETPPGGAGADNSSSQTEHQSSPYLSTGGSPLKASPVSVYDRPAVRTGVNLLMVVLVAFTAYLLWQRFSPVKQQASGAAAGADSLAGSAPEGTADPSLLPTMPPVFDASVVGISRRSNPITLIPNRPRTEVIKYTVKTGDNLFDIAEAYGLMPETILWGNFELLQDNPHLLSPGMELNILPEDGTYYQWKEGDTVEKVAAEFNTTPEKILEFSGNNIDLTDDDDGTYGIEPGTWIVVPGGSRPFRDWGPPAISRANPASAAYYGAGHCGEVYEGPIGYGSFVWPTVDRTISGYHYSAVHRALDIGGSMGNAIFASDSGVVVYSGWSDYGYGNLIVIDHGNGWQTAYAHLSSIAVGCGQGVGQGQVIGGLGSTGNSTGPHLHFEMIYNGTKPNPMDYLY